MDQSRAGLDQALDVRHRIGCARDDPVELPALEPHGLVPDDVDGGDHLEARLVLAC